VKQTAAKGVTAKHAGTAKHGQAKKHSPAQTLAWQKAGAAARKAHRVAKHPAHAKPAALALAGDVACCAAEALAASLRMAGHPVADADVLALYLAITGDPDAGAPIAATLEAAADVGLAGHRPRYEPVTALHTGVVFGCTLPGGRHAATIDGPGVWTWGRWQPFTRPLLADEAWQIEWAA